MQTHYQLKVFLEWHKIFISCFVGFYIDCTIHYVWAEAKIQNNLRQVPGLK